MKKMLCNYYHDGSEWSLTIDTDDDDDWESRIESIRDSLELLGELHGIIPEDPDDKNEYTFDYPD